MKKLFLVFVVFNVFIGCKKAKLKGNYFAFGEAYNMSINDGATFYLVKRGELYPDDMNSYTNQPMRFKNEVLSKDKYELAKKLQDELPEYFYNNASATYGCPDCADQGGFHIQIGEGSSVKTFHIDTDVSKQPQEIRSFVASLKLTLEKLK